MKITDKTRQMIMRAAWAEYKLSQWPWMHKMSFKECLKNAWERLEK